MKSIEQILRPKKDEAATASAELSAGLHLLASTVAIAGLRDEQSSISTEISPITATFLNANKDELGDDISIAIDSRQLPNGDFEAYYVAHLGLVRGIGFTGLATFLRTQAELADGKDFINLSADLETTRALLDRSELRRESQARLAAAAEQEMIQLRAEVTRRGTLEHAQAIVAQDEMTERLKEEFPYVSCPGLSPEEALADRKKTLIEAFISPDPALKLNKSVHIFSPEVIEQLNRLQFSEKF